MLLWVSGSKRKEMVRSPLLYCLFINPYFSYLLKFLSVCLVHILGLRGDKPDPRSLKCIILEYSRTQKGYKFYSPTLYHHFVNFDVTFLETYVYYSFSSSASDSTLPCQPQFPPVSSCSSPGISHLVTTPEKPFICIPSFGYYS